LAPLGLGAEALSADGEFPRFDALRLDLTGARFHRNLKTGRARGAQQSLCFARVVEAAGKPVFVANVAVDFALQAQDVVIGIADAGDGDGKVLVLERAAQGKIDISVQRKNLEQALLEAAQIAARSTGAEVKSVELLLQSESPKTLAVRATVTAKAMFFTTTVVISGAVEVDGQLNARLRDLHCEGDGMIGKMAAGVLRPQFEKLQARVFPLGGAVAGLALSDVTISGGEELRIRAGFHSAA
jgi:hypothetical protein